MLNTDHFALLAGRPGPWDDEIRTKVQSGRTEGTYDSASLCDLQVKQHQKGRRSAELVRTAKGWTIRMASGLQDHRILRFTASPDPSEILCWGTVWANRDPDHRELFICKAEIEKTFAEGYKNVKITHMVTILEATALDPNEDEAIRQEAKDLLFRMAKQVGINVDQLRQQPPHTQN